MIGDLIQPLQLDFLRGRIIGSKLGGIIKIVDGNKEMTVTEKTKINSQTIGGTLRFTGTGKTPVTHIIRQQPLDSRRMAMYAFTHKQNQPQQGASFNIKRSSTMAPQAGHQAPPIMHLWTNTSNGQHSEQPSAQQAQSADILAINRNMHPSSGRPLDPATQTFMESRFKHDFSRVRVHTGMEDVQMSRDLNANAFTVGQDIYFDAGKYAPNTINGKTLIAHELTHVVQAEREGSRGMAREWKGKVSPLNHPSEQEAHLNAHRVMFSNDYIPVYQREDALVQRQPKTAEQKEEKRDDFLKELAKWPQKAHLQWKRLAMNEQASVTIQMAANYGDDFAKEFIKFTKSGPTIEGIDYGPGFPEQTPEWFQKRGYRLAQKGMGYDSTIEWWVHPSGKQIMKIRELSKKAPEKAPPTTKEPPIKEPPQTCAPPVSDKPEQLPDSYRKLVRKFIDESTKKKNELTRQKEKLEKNRLSTDKKTFDQYVKSLGGLGKQVDSQIDCLNKLKLSAKDVSGDVVTTLENGVAELEEIGIWVDVESDPMTLEWLKPLNPTVKESPEEEE